MIHSIKIDETARARIATVLEFSGRPENFFYPYRTRTPGESPEHLIEIGPLICVFSYTVAKPVGVMRHLSATIPGSSGPPPPSLMSELLPLFRFRGAIGDPDIAVAHFEQSRCQVVAFAQKTTPAEMS